jgi:anti-sigma factor RsiW
LKEVIAVNCSDFQKLISAKLDDELMPREEQTLAQHLKVCSNCVRFKEGLEELRATTSAWRNVQIPAELEREILNRTVKTTRKGSPAFRFLRGHYRVPRGLAWASAALFLVLLINFALNPPRTVGEAQRVEESVRGRTGVQKVILTEEDVVRTHTISEERNNL